MNDDVSWIQIIAALLFLVLLCGGAFYFETLANQEIARQHQELQQQRHLETEQRQLEAEQREQKRLAEIETLMFDLKRRHPDWEQLLCAEIAKCSVSRGGRTGLSESLVVENPDWPWGLIARKKIKLGMTDDMVRASWEKPSDINRSVGSWGVHEQWIYRSEDAYLYFENGVLTSWQEDL